MPTVRILADYDSPGYQLLDDAARALGDLPVSDGLRRRLAAWVERFERDCRPPAFEDVSGASFDFVAFAAEGQAIARAVKRELPGWTVRYWDDGLDWYLGRDPRAHDRGRAEYEITLKEALTAPD